MPRVFPSFRRLLVFCLAAAPLALASEAPQLLAPQAGQAASLRSALVDTSASPYSRMSMPGLGEVHWSGGLMGERFEVCTRSMVPHLWEIFQSDKDSHSWSNFLIAAGEGHGLDGKHHGAPFNDGDFLKWFEAVAQLYAVNHDPALDQLMDRIVAVVVKAQREDGYLHTMTIIPQRSGEPGAKEFEQRDHFETYNMGHLMTAACVHYRATGKTTLLAAARKAGDYLYEFFKRSSPELARNAICPSHYMGVVELYRVTREPRYLELAQQLIEIRDLVPNGTDHNQDRVPFRQMTKAVGHAVRANYLYAGVADVYSETGDKSLLSTLETLSADVASNKLYITGMTGALYDGVSPDGSTDHLGIQIVHQAYGRDYQLPNFTAYNETCATIGYALWNWRMLSATGEARYADLFEQSLYNGILPGIDLEGTHYFYVNPLRKSADMKWPLRWSRTREPNIQHSFCCPPNVVRTISEAQNYIYGLSADTLWVNLYGASALATTLPSGEALRLKQETAYPYGGDIAFVLETAPASELSLRLRIPGWLPAGKASVLLNGEPLDAIQLEPGTYAEVRRVWKAGDRLQLTLAFTPELWESNPLVEETADEVALRCGPLVYCLEANDLPTGVKLSDVALPASLTASDWQASALRIVNSDTVAWSTSGLLIPRSPAAASKLYVRASSEKPRSIPLRFVPYYAWGNRGDTDMSIWLPRR